MNNLAKTKKIAAIVPIYNEMSNVNFEFRERLVYFQNLAKQHNALFDLFIVDDGSTDGTQSEILGFVTQNNVAFQVVTLPHNRQKAGAIKEAIAPLSHPYILTIDFDTDLGNLENLDVILNQMEGNPKYMGCALHILIYTEASGILAAYYRFIFHLGNAANDKSLQDGGDVLMIPGAAALYRRSALQQILAEHSEQYCADDWETTIIGLRLGYQAFQSSRVQAMTRYPQRFLAVHNQQFCWKAGHLRVIVKEWTYCWDQIKGFSRFGQQVLAEIGYVLLHLMLPIVLACLFILNWTSALFLLMTIYGLIILLLLRISNYPQSTVSGNISLKIILLFPFLWFLIEAPASWRAMGQLSLVPLKRSLAALLEFRLLTKG